MHKYKGLPVFFICHGDSDFHFDIFSAIFYLITRYEEYLPLAPINMGGFSRAKVLPLKHSFIEEPIVELWIEIFKEF